MELQFAGVATRWLKSEEFLFLSFFKYFLPLHEEIARLLIKGFHCNLRILPIREDIKL